MSPLILTLKQYAPLFAMKTLEECEAHSNLNLYYIPQLQKLENEINNEELAIRLSLLINFHDDYGHTALKEAARHGILDCIKPLVTIGATPSLEMFTTSLHEALYTPKKDSNITRYQVLKTLLKALKNPRKYRFGEAKSFHAIVNKKPAPFKNRDPGNIDSNSQRIMRSGNTVLNELLYQESIDVRETAKLTRLLLRYGADPLVKNTDGETAVSLLLKRKGLKEKLLEDVIDAIPLVLRKLPPPLQWLMVWTYRQ